MVKYLLPLILVLLIGCTVAPSTSPMTAPIEVKVPIFEPIYCAAPKLTRPKLPVSELVLTSPAADTVRAYAASIVLLKGAVRQRDEVIAGCVTPTGRNQGAEGVHTQAAAH
jgi:hypothetical protein